MRETVLPTRYRDVWYKTPNGYCEACRKQIRFVWRFCSTACQEQFQRMSEAEKLSVCRQIILEHELGQQHEAEPAHNAAKMPASDSRQPGGEVGIPAPGDALDANLEPPGDDPGELGSLF